MNTPTVHPVPLIPCSSCCRTAGFTLIEVLAFVVIISLAVTATVPLYIQTLLNVSQVRDASQAAALATETVETAVALCLYTPVGGVGTTKNKGQNQGNNGVGRGKAECVTDGYDAIVIGTALPASEDITLGALTVTRTIEIQGFKNNKCTGAAPVPSDKGKCVVLDVTDQETGKSLASSTLSFLK
jgi:type II secretory pathway pseudopilin PulG